MLLILFKMLPVCAESSKKKEAYIIFGGLDPGTAILLKLNKMDYRNIVWSLQDANCGVYDRFVLLWIMGVQMQKKKTNPNYHFLITVEDTRFLGVLSCKSLNFGYTLEDLWFQISGSAYNCLSFQTVLFLNCLKHFSCLPDLRETKKRRKKTITW